MSDTKLLSKSNIELNDITLNANYIRLKEMIEELKEKNVRQEDFLLNISHDMRAHLNVIISVMQCIDYGSVDISDKKALEYMNIVKRNSFKMLKLINNLIDTTRLENNYYILNKKNIDIVSMIEGTISCIDRYAKQKIYN
ncbi:sensor histidine kinase [Clostridium chauvoei]|uniref:sensor histidine kinase n=1 Tax=Clostridium chauvoei TaxID=46867 RepID=UPI001FA92E0D|nr:histidine kinase dimerization/phospho-acceptor domain-containing protein [Clostridium chauvoei]